jgi:glucose-6-phosphate 1-dehydrogenase
VSALLGRAGRPCAKLRIRFQLAVPPSQFTSLADKLHKNNYKGTSNRLVIEKPFGKDSDSAKEMMDAITKDGWKQEEVYRIDHFIGDEMVCVFHVGQPCVGS